MAARFLTLRVLTDSTFPPLTRLSGQSPSQEVNAGAPAKHENRYPGDATKAAIELYPVSGKKVTAAAAGAGLVASSIPTLLVEGDNKPGLGLAITEAISGARVNISFFVAQSIGRRFSAVLGFETEADAKTAAPVIKKAAAGKKR